MGLAHILVYSSLAGISLGFVYSSGGGPLQGGLNFAILDSFTKYFDSNSQVVILAIFLVVGLYSIYSLSKFFRQVLERPLIGIITATLGFFGALLIIFSSELNSHVFFLGIGIWVNALLLVIWDKKKNNKRKRL